MSEDDDVRRGGDTRAGSPDKANAEDARDGAIREASLRERLQAQLALLRTQVRRLNQALARGADTVDPAQTTPPSPSPPSLPPVDGQRDASPRSPAIDQATSKAAPATPVPAAFPLSTAGNGLTQTDKIPPLGSVGAERPGALVLLEINETDLRAMIHDGLLSRADIANPARISAALQMIVARWRSTVAIPPPPPPETRVERRRGRERRRSAPRASSLLSYVTETEFDRRTGSDRRRAKRAHTGDAAPTLPAPTNLVTLADARTRRIQRQRRELNPSASEPAAALLPIRRRRLPAEDAPHPTGKPRLEKDAAGTVVAIDPHAGDHPVDNKSQMKPTRRRDSLPQADVNERKQPRDAGEPDER